jgi:hypothetical protein
MHRFGLSYQGVRYSATARRQRPVQSEFINNLIVARFTPTDKAKTSYGVEKSPEND